MGLNKTKRSVLIVLWLAVMGLSLVPIACVTGKKDRGEEFGLDEAELKKLRDYQAEIEVGRNMAGRLLAFYGNQESQELLKYVNRVGKYVASVGDYPDRNYMFEILDSDIVNAFACPGGYILVTMGTLRHAKSEAELAMVLGHEAVHVGKLHMFNLLQSMDNEALESTANEMANQDQLPESVMVRKRPEPESSEAGSMLARYASGAAAGLNVLKAARAGMSVMLEKGLGADKEYEADREGVKYAIRAGYEPDALEDFLCRLQESKEGKPTKERKCRLDLTAAHKNKGKKQTILDKTHPPIAERVKNIRDVLQELQAKEIIGAAGIKRYNLFKKYVPNRDDDDA